MNRRPTIKELEEMLEKEEDTQIEILPTGDIRHAGGSASASQGWRAVLPLPDELELRPPRYDLRQRPSSRVCCQTRGVGHERKLAGRTDPPSLDHADRLQATFDDAVAERPRRCPRPRRP